jgi:sugar lactone lactonase YvrE
MIQMKKYNNLFISALMAATVFSGVEARADNMAEFAIAPATGAVTLTPRWTIGGNLAGFHHMSQDIGLTGSVANDFYSITNTVIPAGGNVLAFNFYVPASGAASPHNDIGSKLTPDFYSALTSADPDVGFGAVNFYLIHHKGTTDYFTTIIPGSAVASAVTDLKPMSGPGGPGTVTGVNGYFGLTFAGADLGYGANNFYYLRTDPVTSTTKFGSLVPALLATSADSFDLGMGGHNALEFTGTDVGYGVNQLYYLRLDPITGFTILGTLNPALAGLRHTADIANLGSVYSTLNFSPTDLGFGVNHFYTTGTVNTTWQSVSFAAIQDRAIVTGPFNVNPTASSALPIVLTVVPGSVGAASIADAGGGVFTVTPTAPGLITLQATQAGQAAPAAPVYEYNMLRQSFTITGVATLQITTQPTSQTAVTGTTANFTVVASGTSTLSYQWRKAGTNIAGNASATTATLTLTNVQAADEASYDVAVSNASGTIFSDPVTLTVIGAAPIITNSPLTVAGTVGDVVSYQITASGSPTSFSASPLPAGLTVNTATGVISGTLSAAATTSILLGATNASGTGNATLVATIAAAGVAPVITNSPLTAAGTVGTAFSFAIVATGSPTSYSASPLPAGVTIDTTTGVLSGTPTAVGSTSVLLGATNATGTGNATLVVTVAAAGVAPIITNNPLTAAGTVGTPFSFTITASGLPTSYSASPLPAGVVINTTTGALTGTPTAVGTTNVLLGATNAIGTGNATLVVTVVAAGVAPIITNNPLTAGGTVGTPFSFSITASGLPTSYSASPLPAGVVINTVTGALTGTPTAVGTTSVTLGATNTTGTGNATLTITVVAAAVAPTINNSPLTAAGVVGTPFSFLITAAGLPLSYSASPLPAGVVINTATGALTGTPTATGITSVTLGATNATGTGNATLVITVTAVPAITSASTASGTVGSAFSFSITASGTPTSFSASPLPAGLTVSTTTGAITGTPTTVGTTTVTLGATNATGTGNATLTITVAPLSTPGITNSPLTAAGVVGTPFSFTITASSLPASFSASPLPGGLVFNTATGAITGTPTTVGTTTVQLGATNTTGTGNAAFTITITAALVAPVVTLQPVSQTVAAGQGTNFTVAGDGDRNPAETFLWQRLPAGSTTWVNLYEGGSYHGVTTATLTVSPTTPAMAGDQFRSVIMNATDFTTSNVVTLTVMPGIDFMFQYPASIAMDASGNLYVADTLDNTIRKITPAGVVSTLAGASGEAGSQDGTDGGARFNHPDGVTVDSAGNIYVTDNGNATIRKVTSAGVVTTMAGTAGVHGSADATGSAASFGSPTGIAVDTSGNLYVADTSNDTIRKITTGGAVSTLAGAAATSGNVDGTGNAARFNMPRGVAVDTTGNVYVADTNSATIRKITSAGVVTTMAGTAGATGTADGLGAAARFNQPYGVSVDAAGNVYVADTGNDTIRAVTPGGAVVTLAGMPGVAGLRDGAGSTAEFNLPHGLMVSAGSIYVADTGNSTIRLVSPTDVVSTLPVSVPSTVGTTTPPASGTIPPPASTGGGGGGGAIDTWFLALIALIGAIRFWSKATTQPRTS